MNKKLLKVFTYLILVLTALVLLLVRPIDNTPYREQAYYQQTLNELTQDAVQVAGNPEDTLLAGWGRANITPQTPAKLMGYGYKGNYTRVQDSTFVRVVVFSKGNQKIALVSYDLMMVHPALAQAVRRATDTLVDHYYFTAVHTHHSYGEWATGLSGRVIAGGYNKDLVRYMAQQTRQAVVTALAHMAPVQIGYQAHAHPARLANRLVANGPTDPHLRVISVRKAGGATALICTFAAHATLIPSRSKDLSADYPGALVRQLETDSLVDFALFAAGAVGSHAPVGETGPFSYHKLTAYARQLATPVLSQATPISYPDTSKQTLAFAAVPLWLGEPQFKINERWRLSPWLFRVVFGELQPRITLLQISSVLLVGFPGDFSGMLVPQLHHPAGMHVVATSFNGDYVGYIIPDKYYHERDQEAKEMNWFGPYTGSYVVEIANRLLEQVTSPL